MKRSILILLAMLGMMNTIQAQSYHPLLNNSSWYVNKRNFAVDEDFWVYYVKDTTISSMTYQMYTDSNVNYTSFVREDTSTRQVHRNHNGSDELLFDFSLQVGDSVALGDGFTYHVWHVDTVTVMNSGQRKRMYLRFPNSIPILRSQSWIEGVGMIERPLRPPFNLPSDPAFSLRCSHQDGDNIYNWGIQGTGTPDTCPPDAYAPPDTSGEPTHVGMVPDQGNPLVFPNPVERELNIELPTGFGSATIVLRDQKGRIVHANEHVNGSVVKISTGGLPSGIYMLEIANTKQVDRRLIFR